MNGEVQTSEEPSALLRRPAGFWIRSVAFIIDSVIFLPVLALGVYSMSSINFTLYLVSVVPFLLYKPIMEARCGATVGKMICKIKVVSATDGGPISLRDAYLRFLPLLVYSLSQVMLMYHVTDDSRYVDATSFVERAAVMRLYPMYGIKQMLSLVVSLDCVAIAFRREKKAIHDSIAGTRCVYRPRAVTQ